MSKDERDHLFRDNEGAAVERAARLEEENARLRAELARRDRPAPAVPPPRRPASLVAPMIAVVVVMFAVGVVGAMLVVARGRGGPVAVAPVPKPIETAVSFTGAPVPTPIPPPLPPEATMAAASGSAPTPAPTERVVEIRSSPPGADVVIAGKRVGKTPLLVRVPAKSAGACTGGTCIGASCAGGTCSGGTCAGAVDMNGTKVGGTCMGGTCMGGTCSGGTCTGQTCPSGYECVGGACSGGTCSGGACMGGTCMNGACGGGGTCAGQTCMGATCTGGVCEPVTTARLELHGAKASVEIRPTQSVVGVTFPASPSAPR